MSKIETVDISSIEFESSAFPTNADMSLWNRLEDKQKFLLIQKAEEDGFRSGIAKPESMEERLRRVRAETADEL